MRKLLAIAFMAGAAATFVGCSGSANNTSANSAEEKPDARPRALPMPVIPPQYDKPELRLRYALGAYWNGLDFSDRSLSLDTAFMEQSFSNFIGLMQYEPTAAPPAMSHLVDNAAADTLATIFIWDIADKYLNEPNSPMRDGEFYRAFLLALEKSPVVTDAYRDKLMYQIVISNLNRPGSVPNDFRYVTRDGGRTSLLASAKGMVTMLIFYDPDCELCKGIMGNIANASLPEDLKVVAVDVEDDRKLWEQTAGSLPKNWEVGFAIDDLNDERLYHLPALPTIYLLDSEGRVLLKDPTPQTAISTAVSILSR